MKSGSQHPQWKGYGEIPGGMFKQYKNNAKIRKIPFNITIEQMWDLFIKQNRKCALTGWPLVFHSLRKRKQTTASLDRIDSNKPYQIDNVQWVHKDINRLKHKFSIQDIIYMAKLVAKHNENV